MLTKEASNALLKTLEEPPPHVIFILATTEAHKVLATILSRCQRFDFRRLSQADVVTKLTGISQSEGIKIEPEALRLIARAATGSLRDAENILQQMTTYYGQEIEMKQVQAILGITGDERTKELVRHIIANDVAAGVTTINRVNSDGLDLRQFNRELVAYLRGLLLVKTGSAEAVDLPAEDIAELKSLAAKASLSQILKAVKRFGQLELGLDNYSTLPLELALVDSTFQAEAKPPIQAEETSQEARDTAATPTVAAGESGPVRKTAARQPKEAPTPVPETFPPESQEEAVPEPKTKSKPASTSEPKADIEPESENESDAEPEPAAVPPSASASITEAAHSSPSELSVEINKLQVNWWQFIRQAPDGLGRTPAAALLRSAKLKAIEKDTVILSFKFPLHRDNMEKPDNQQIAERIISSFLGRSCSVRCIYEPEANHLIEEALRIGAQIIDAEEK
jgi:DNA polymerase-3 subunit gamma/tau